MKFLLNEQNVSVMYIDINAISLYLDLNIFQQDECFCSKLGMEVECAKSNLKTSFSQFWVICQLLPFVRVGQNRRKWELKYYQRLIIEMSKSAACRRAAPCRFPIPVSYAVWLNADRVGSSGSSAQFEILSCHLGPQAFL